MDDSWSGDLSSDLVEKYHSKNICSCDFRLAKSISYSAIVFCSIIQKASNALEVLKEVLDAVDAQHPQVGQGYIKLKSEFCFRGLWLELYIDSH